MSGLMPGNLLQTRLMGKISCSHCNGPIILVSVAYRFHPRRSTERATAIVLLGSSSVSM